MKHIKYTFSDDIVVELQGVKLISKEEYLNYSLSDNSNN